MKYAPVALSIDKENGVIVCQVELSVVVFSRFMSKNMSKCA